MDNKLHIHELLSLHSTLNGSVFTKRNSHIEFQKELIDGVTASVVAPGPYYYFVYDGGTKEIIYASNTLKDFTGLDPANYKLADYLGCIHPDDLKHQYECERVAGDYLFNIVTKSDYMHYKVTYSYRVKDAQGVYRIVLHQGIAFNVDDNGLMDQTLHIETDVSHIVKNNNMRLSLVGINGRRSYMSIDPYGDHRLNETQLFTARELDILRLMTGGTTAKDIADQLGISYNTVRTHKQNMLHKCDVKNSGELIAKALKLNML